MSVAEEVASARTYLFVPASRPDRFQRACESGADVVILDLEDAVPPPGKAAAREAAVNWLASPRGGPVTMVRINAVGTPWHEADVTALRKSGAPLMLPKAESSDQIARLGRCVDDLVVVALIETPRGVLRAEEIAAAPATARLALGHIDLAAALGVRPDAREAFLHARSQLVLASAAAGIASPVDGVTTALGDVERLRDDVTYAEAVGMTGKLCIHPRQIGVVHDAIRPSETDIEWARRVVASVGDGGAAAVDGEMIDPPVIARARRLLLLAQR